MTICDWVLIVGEPGASLLLYVGDALGGQRRHRGNLPHTLHRVAQGRLFGLSRELSFVALSMRLIQHDVPVRVVFELTFRQFELLSV